jgi:hypothetical protein
VSDDDRENLMSPAWYCAICGAHHEGLATVFGPSAPEPWAEATDGERRQGEINDDLCFLPGPGVSRAFIRGHLRIKAPQLPDEWFIWSVWVELSVEDMEMIEEHWLDLRREELLPMPGTLATELPYAQPTRGLGVRMFTRSPGEVPLFKLDRSQAHQLVEEQRQGVSLHRVAELNALMLAQ